MSSRIFRTRTLFVVVAIVAVSAFAASAAPKSSTHMSALRVDLEPAVVTLQERATIAVWGSHVGPLEVELSGATDFVGTQLRWQPLHLVDGVWRGTLPAPALRGIYPVFLRVGVGSPLLGQEPKFLRVFAPGTLRLPSFGDPADVARWWVSTVRHAMLDALKRWQRPDFDRRDLRLHRLFVVAYSPPGHPGVDERKGIFITAVRDGYAGRWRLLDATLDP